ncbi:hypothetical protein KP79_PYT04673 [Mizuhopecten yessoensis]|uniref:Uncharacterized protein n=1 Tax=Mizuhopecten yessoensis TaxID=6573 RepID=A0A210PM38_MIZYE|nr:hypothetical protein KP79_PYT04673 [Mizuhopecten yessoensis]
MKAAARNPRLDQRLTPLESEQRFRRAFEQIVQLNYKLDELQSRYLGTKRDGLRTGKPPEHVLRLCPPEG